MTPGLDTHTLVSLVALGMGIAFVSADRASPASRALAGGFFFMGLSIYLNVVWLAVRPELMSWAGWFALPEVLSIVCMLEWILRVRRTIPVSADMDTRTGDRVLRLGQLSGVLYGVFSFIWPELRAQAFLRAGDRPELFLSAGFWVFMGPVLLAMIAGCVGIALLLKRRPDRAETIRVVAMALAAPLFVAGFVLPLQWSALSVITGELVFLIGAVHYHVLQGQRGQFMSRFLSPQVARLVSERGLDQAMRDTQREITVVACDLRGFTAYAAAHPSAEVIAVLREYYDAVGARSQRSERRSRISPATGFWCSSVRPCRLRTTHSAASSWPVGSATSVWRSRSAGAVRATASASASVWPRVWSRSASSVRLHGWNTRRWGRR